MLTTRVTFDLHGKRCTAIFDNVAEALAWIEVCYEKGFMLPISVQGGTNDDNVRYSHYQLIEMMNI